MTKSSMPRRALPPLCLLAAPAALAAQSPTPEEAIERQQAEVRAVVGQVCPAGADPGDPNDVVVCGPRRPEIGNGGFRVPRVPEPGRISRVQGEGPTGDPNPDACLRLCTRPVMIDVFAAARALRRGLDRLLHPD